MKKLRFLALILAFVMVAFTLAACGNEENTNPRGNDNGSSINSDSGDNGSGDENSGDASSEDNGSEDNGSEGSSDNGGAEADAEGVAAAALKLANELIGTEYKSGGTGPDEFDNSGFVYYIFRQSGYKMPRRIPDMAKEGKEVGRDDLKAGDVLIFSNEIDGDAAFVAISAGGDEFISCNRPDSPTDLHKFSNYYEQRFICGRRIG
ncbi:MAG: C40 family peptidase [Clostridia bacterium]|nr:C40 family peptidase [Clostridia bacterium]